MCQPFSPLVSTFFYCGTCVSVLYLPEMSSFGCAFVSLVHRTRFARRSIPKDTGRDDTHKETLMHLLQKPNRDWLHPTPAMIRRDTFRKHFWRRGKYRAYANTFALEGTENVIEFGSGSGALSRFIARRLRAAGTLTCVDISEAWQDAAKKHLARYTNVTYLAGDLRKLDLPGAHFDAAVIHYMLHDVEVGLRPGYVEALAEKLKFGGVLYIREPVAEKHGMSPYQIRVLMTDNGLKEIDFTLDTREYTGVFAK